MPIADHPYAPKDPVNRRVEADQMAGYTHAYLRRIVYLDPASDERFVFITPNRACAPE